MILPQTVETGDIIRSKINPLLYGIVIRRGKIANALDGYVIVVSNPALMERLGQRGFIRIDDVELKVKRREDATN